MNEMALVIPVIVITMLMAAGTVLVMAKFVRQREKISAVREETGAFVEEEDIRMAA